MDVVRGFPALVLVLALASPAAAHLALRYPSSRYGDNVLKIGPCGQAGGARSENVTVLEAEASIEVVWDEYVNHPGHFRISFDVDGDDDFVDPPCSSHCNTRTPEVELYSNDTVLLDGIADTPLGGEGRATIELPDVECERCTLQVIQVMYDKPPYVIPGNDIYYQCADLVIHRSVASTPTSTSPATPTPTPSGTPAPRPTPKPTPTRSPSHTPALPACVGDCILPGDVTSADLVAGVTIALDDLNGDPCLASFDVNTDDSVTVEELIAAVKAVDGCTASGPRGRD